MSFRIGDKVEHVDAIGGRVFTVRHIAGNGGILVTWESKWGLVCCDTPQLASDFVLLGSLPPVQAYLELFQ